MKALKQILSWYVLVIWAVVVVLPDQAAAVAGWQLSPAFVTGLRIGTAMTVGLLILSEHNVSVTVVRSEWAGYIALLIGAYLLFNSVALTTGAAAVAADTFVSRLPPGVGLIMVIGGVVTVASLWYLLRRRNRKTAAVSSTPEPAHAIPVTELAPSQPKPATEKKGARQATGGRKKK
jgi:hypothetical protein